MEASRAAILRIVAREINLGLLKDAREHGIVRGTRIVVDKAELTTFIEHRLDAVQVGKFYSVRREQLGDITLPADLITTSTWIGPPYGPDGEFLAPPGDCTVVEVCVNAEDVAEIRGLLREYWHCGERAQPASTASR